MAAGLLRPAHGRVDATATTWLDTERGIDVPAERRRCGYVFQDYALFPHLSAWQNVAYPLRGMSRAERRARALELLERFGLGGPRRRAAAHAERRRAPAGRARAGARARPEVLLLDEPLSALDARTRADAARELGAAAARERGAGAARHPRLRRGGAARRPRRRHRPRAASSRRAPPASSRPRRARRSSPTSPAPSCSPAPRARRRGGLTEVALDGGGTVVTHRRRRRAGRRERLPVGDRARARRASRRSRARPRTGWPPRSSRSRPSATASGSG